MIGYKETWFATAKAATKPENMQGYHEKNMLFIVDEAAGVADNIFDAILGTLSGENNKLLILGNPTKTTGEFHRSHTVDRSLYYCMTVNAENVKGLGSWINTNRNIVSGLYPLADQTKLSNIEEGAEKNFIRSVNTEQFTVNTEGKLDLAQNYVLTSLYRAEVGNLDDLVRAEGGEGNTTIVDEINYINERLQWQTINE